MDNEKKGKKKYITLVKKNMKERNHDATSLASLKAFISIYFEFPNKGKCAVEGKHVIVGKIQFPTFNELA